MTPDRLALEYLEALEKGSLPEILALFTSDAQVISPLYGQIGAKDFYKQLLTDTHQSKLNLIEVFQQKNGEKIAVYFNYQWTMQHQKVVSFDVVDILELESGKIKTITIIYDTYQTRTAFQELPD